MTLNALAGVTVLVVDDYADSRFMLRRMLEVKDYFVREAADGREAVEAARRGCPDLILMDLNMPHMDGLMATERIRQCKEACCGIPIVALTAFDTYGMKEAAIEAGCDAYLTKPIDPDELDKELRRLLPGW